MPSLPKMLFLTVLMPAAAFEQVPFYPAFENVRFPGPQYIAAASDGLGNTINPALIPVKPGFGAAIITEKRFLLKELSCVFIGAVKSFGRSAMSVSVYHFGGSDYSERSAGIGYGKDVGPLKIGMNASYFTAKTGSNQFSLLTTCLSTVISLNDKVAAGLRVSNVQSLLRNRNQTAVYPAASFSLGLGYRPSDAIYAGADITKSAGKRVSTSLLLLYDVNDKYRFRCSWATATHQPYAGMRWQLKNIAAEAGVSYHMSLGISPAFILFFDPKGS